MPILRVVRARRGRLDWLGGGHGGDVISPRVPDYHLTTHRSVNAIICSSLLGPSFSTRCRIVTLFAVFAVCQMVGTKGCFCTLEFSDSILFYFLVPVGETESVQVTGNSSQVQGLRPGDVRSVECHFPLISLSNQLSLLPRLR